MTIFKFQINFKSQYSMAKTFQDETLFGFSNFGHWGVFDIWIFNKSFDFLKKHAFVSLHQNSMKKLLF